MTNNKQQTAVEWFNSKIKQLEFWVETRQITWKEYHKEKYKLLEQAKGMDKGQRQHTFEQSRLNNKFVGLKYESFDQYYNETYGGGEQ
jgi:hypothetical protein